MMNFSDWLKIRESSSATRLKTQAALGLAPPVADIFSRSTPPPWQVDRLKKALKKSHKKKNRKKTKKKTKTIHEASASKIVDPNIDAFIKSVENLAKDLWELQLAKKKKETEKKIKKITKKYVDKKKKNEKEEKLEKKDKPKKKDISKKEIKSED